MLEKMLRGVKMNTILKMNKFHPEDKKKEGRFQEKKLPVRDKSALENSKCFKMTR